MSRLILVRHAQASFFAEDYDRLSAHGEEQAIALASHWIALDRSLDEIYVGPRQRHRRTADIIAERYHSEGREWPEIVSLPEFDENHVDQLIARHRELLEDRLPHVRELYRAVDEAERSVDKQRGFQRLFEAVARSWSEDQTPDQIESYSDFRDRVNRGIDRATVNDARGRTIVVFTSVGPISACLGRVLRCDNRVALETGWRVWNCSLTEFVFSGDRMTLDRFNALPHLPNPTDWTYR